MNHEMVILLLSLGILLLLCIVIYQRITFRKGLRQNLMTMSEKLKEISDTGSDEMVMVFTESKELIKLAEQINRLLEVHRKTKADFRRTEMSSRKMLSNISHDIKTPLTVVLGYLEIMRLHGADSKEMLEKVSQKAQNVMELINEFFTLAKLEAGDMDIALSALPVNELCRESILGFYELLMKDDWQVAVNIPELPIYASGNQEALERILCNLISNAVRYGADGRYLGITLREEGAFVYIDITDQGKGIEKRFADHVFDRLFTLEDSRSRQVQGNGLGLTIAKNLALQMGGDVTLDSQPGIKTVFTVQLEKISHESIGERNL